MIDLGNWDFINRLTKCSACGSRRIDINSALSSIINIYWGLFCPIFRQIASCPQSSVHYWKKRWPSHEVEMHEYTCAVVYVLILCFFHVLRIYWEEQLAEQFWYLNFSLYYTGRNSKKKHPVQYRIWQNHYFGFKNNWNE